MTDNRTTELLREGLTKQNGAADSTEQAVAATLGSEIYDLGFKNGIHAVFQQLEDIEDYEELQCFIAEYWREGEGNDER